MAAWTETRLDRWTHDGRLLSFTAPLTHVVLHLFPCEEVVSRCVFQITTCEVSPSFVSGSCRSHLLHSSYVIVIV
jgi:hypothetical protein